MHLMRLLSRLLTTSFALWCICFPFVASKATNSKLKTAVTKTKALSSSKVQSSSPTSTSEKFIFSKKNSKGDYVLTYFGLMVAGAIARSVSATAIHPLNVIKIMLQKQGGKMPALNFQTMTRGAGSQFIMSIPHGAINFVITETTKAHLLLLSGNLTIVKKISPRIIDPILDFLSSSISTFICSIVSTPQMVLTDRIMAGLYPDFFSAIKTIYRSEGFAGFYLGWLPALVQKIPSYALTWMFFQQCKVAFVRMMNRAATSLENLLLGSLAAAGACCIMIPVDTIKTRLVTQGTVKLYSGMMDCLQKMLREEGIWSFYRALTPRLLSVVPMIGIQFMVYELIKRLMLHQPPPVTKKASVSRIKKSW